MSRIAATLIKREIQTRTGKLRLQNLDLTLSTKDVYLTDDEDDFVSPEEYSLIEQIDQLDWLESLNVSSNYIHDLEFLGNMNKLKDLNLAKNYVNSSEAKVLGKIASLVKLNLGQNRISGLGFLHPLKNLELLNLAYNSINSLKEIGNLNNLIELNLIKNKIVSLNGLENLQSLEKISLGHNAVKDIGALSSLTRLKVLNLKNNALSGVINLGKFQNLEHLDISENRISNLKIEQPLLNLKTLNLASNEIDKISFIENFPNLETLILSDNQIESLNPIDHLKRLKNLEIGNIKLKSLEVLKNHQNLVSLNASSNSISDLFDISLLSSLEHLYLADNNIKDITPIERLSRLKTLDLSRNTIYQIGTISKMTNLEFLDICNNKVSNISHLKGLVGLQSINLTQNQIEDISPLLPLMKLGLSVSIKYLVSGISIGQNPIANPPLAIVVSGRDAIINWFEQISEQGEEPFYEAKLMILGQGGAGKTTFSNLLIDPDYELTSSQEESTLGIEVHKGKEFKHIHANELIKAHVWDFGGQDIQKMLHQFFITDNCLYVIVSDKRSENTNFDYWFQIINLLGPQSSVIVLENPKNINSSNDDFPLTKYQELFPNLKIQRIEVDLSKTKTSDRTNWKVLNELIAKELSILEIVNRPVPKKWTFIRDELVKRKEFKHIGKDAYYEICSSPDIALSRPQSDLCLLYLRELGDLAYFDDTALHTHIFLDHNWLTKGMYYILSDKQIQKDKGRFERHQAYSQWNLYDYDEREKAMLLRLLLKDQFDICYELPNENNVFITPLLLPNDKPEKWDNETNLRFRYQYGFIPLGMFSRLIVRVNQMIHKEQRWKTGVRLTLLLEKHITIAEVQQIIDPDENQTVIDIKISGKKNQCKELLNNIRVAIEELHKEYKNIKFNRIVACNCKLCTALTKKGLKPSFYDFEKLQKKIRNRKYFEECEKSDYDSVNIGTILNDIILENAAFDNLEYEWLGRLREMGVSFNEIKNFAQTSVEMSDFGNSEAKSTVNVINNLNLEIENILSDTKLLKEDINDEKELLKESIGIHEVELALKNLGKAEQAFEVIEKQQEPNIESKARLKNFVIDLTNKESSLYKTLRTLRRGRDYGVRIADAYNKIAANTGLPLIPPVGLDIIRDL